MAALSREDFEKTIGLYVARSEPCLGRPLLAVVDALFADRDVTREDLEALVQAASSGAVAVKETGISLLRQLALKSASGREAIQAMAVSRSTGTRCNALASLDRDMPPEFVEAIVYAALKDKSAPVRRVAAEKVGEFRTRGGLNELSNAALRESNKNTLDTLKHEARLLRDGYAIQGESENSTHLVIETARGRVVVPVSSVDVQEKGLQALADEVRRQVSGG